MLNKRLVAYKLRKITAELEQTENGNYVVIPIYLN